MTAGKIELWYGGESDRAQTGKLRAKFTVSADFGKEELEAYVRENYPEVFDGKTVVKFIAVPGRIVNVVVK